MRYILATNNKGKFREARPIFASAGIKIESLEEIGLSFEPEENENTFADNAVSKAVQCLEWLRGSGITDATVFADDSGLCIDALDGMPGVMSSRFLGVNTSYKEKNETVLDMLKDLPHEKRTARFVTIFAAAYPDGKVITSNGAVEGIIAGEQRGDEGFGYDPIFFLPDYNRTMAELTFEEKNRISHRTAAVLKMIELICVNL